MTYRHLVGTYLVACAVSAQVQGTIVNLSGVPDLSQHADIPWNNYCAPTSGANVAYYFGQTYSNLQQGYLSGDAGGAAVIIDGIAGNSMVNFMGTTTSGGTTGSGVLNGLDTYLENNWDLAAGGTDWNTQYLDANILGGSTFWNNLQTEISNGSGVILLIAWFGGAPAGYETPDGYTPGVLQTSTLGHAVTMTGFDTTSPTNTLSINDPANNGGGAHNWPGEGAAYGVTINPSDISIILGGSGATIYGAVVTNIPGPGALTLLALSGLIAASSGRRRRIN